MLIDEIPMKTIERFNKKINPNKTENGCLLWIGCKTGAGYGGFTYQNKSYSAHVFSWILATKKIPSKKSVIRHTCDIRHCVNPEHLICGTQSENIKDCVAKGRYNRITRAKGENVNSVKLTQNQVEEIRKYYIPFSRENSSRKLAKKYNVSHNNILAIVHQKTWKIT